MLSNRLLTALAPATWGTTYLVTTEYLPPDRPLLAALLRSLPAGLLLVAVTRRLPAGDWWWRSLVLGALNIGAFLPLLFLAAYRLPGGVAATVGAVQPLMVAGLAAGLLGQRMTLRVALAAVAGVAGVSLLVLRADARLDWIGVTAALGGAAVMAAGTVLSKRWRSPAPLLASTGWQLVAGGLLLLPVTLLVEGAPPALSATNVAGYTYLATVGAALSYSLWFRGIGLLPATEVTFLGLLSPVVATAVGWLALGQDLTVAQAFGAVVVLAALVVAQTRGRTGRLPSRGRAGRRPPLRSVPFGWSPSVSRVRRTFARPGRVPPSAPTGRSRTTPGTARRCRPGTGC
ncbi:putative blue pigment (indigoidine) exporter [Saccharothrix tamanrassetensis]|uniref:Putative blue pigment (Indigoidine) exporter n=1 Tax=Saccharothrix tamanrassetensis TaxID=1051531 RepID=A0A841CSS1_9PSEU|nr:EamA family transporter [Saccharothrix tamanrassetensis]MBB5960349.1 putative blue pigment (indigoidine) exporter [Saccharothrix tamanrassetensis]